VGFWATRPGVPAAERRRARPWWPGPDG
jgi:hypothetical protein